MEAIPKPHWDTCHRILGRPIQIVGVLALLVEEKGVIGGMDKFG